MSHRMSKEGLGSMACKVLVAFAGIIGYLVGTSSSGVTPPIIPVDSPLQYIPSWPLYRVGVTINHWLARATVATTPPHVQVMEKAMAHWQSHAIYALVKNDIMEALGEGSADGTSCQEVAERLSLHEHGVCEFIRAGVQMDLIDIVSSSLAPRYKPSVQGELLLKKSPRCFRDLVLAANEEMSDGWKVARTTALQKGERDGFSEMYGKSYYDWLADHPELEAQFARAMTNLGSAFVGAFVADYPFPITTGAENHQNKSQKDFVFCDVGGGIGTSVAIVLQHYPSMKGLVFDQETVAPLANEFLSSKGLADRANAVSGSFLEPLPDELESCDVFFLKYILHNWSDENGIKILSNIKNTAKPGSKVVILENVIGTMPERSGMELNKALMSLNMYSSWDWGSQERTLEHFGQLFSQAEYSNKPELMNLRELLSAIVVEV